MKKKSVIRKVWDCFSVILLIYMTVKVLLGTATTLEIVSIVICYSSWGFCFISWIVLQITNYKKYKYLVDGFEYLQAVHKARYKFFFTGDKKKLEEYSAEIDEYGNHLLNAIRTVVLANILSKKQINTIEKIMDKTQTLMTSDKGL